MSIRVCETLESISRYLRICHNAKMATATDVNALKSQQENAKNNHNQRRHKATDHTSKITTTTKTVSRL